MDKNITKKIVILVLLGLGYFVAGKLGLSLAHDNPSATAVWAPTGIALAAFLIIGDYIWPAILLGAFFVNFSITHHILSSIAISIGNTAEGWLGAYLTKRFAQGKFFYLESINVKKFVFFGGLGAAISATVGVLTVGAKGNFGLVWSTWWIGDVAGAIIVTPLLILLITEKFTHLTRTQIIERVIYFVTTIAISIAVFGNIFDKHPIGFLIIPLFVWTGLRFSQKESAIATLVISAIAIYATVSGVGAFVKIYPVDTLLMLQSYIAVISLTSLVLAAAVAERKAAQAELLQAYDQALEGWSTALDLRDKETDGHTRRVTELTLKLAETMGLGVHEMSTIRSGSLLHDIGKICIPDDILFKTGQLEEEERKIMAKHPAYAFEILHNTALKGALDIPYCHHERWDGQGYPRGLKGEEIPLAARIFALADVWDALKSNRRYKPGMSEREILDYIESMAGKQFDPKIAFTFAQMMKKEAQANTSSALRDPILVD